MYLFAKMTWAESGSYSESKTSLSLYRSLFVKGCMGPEFNSRHLQKVFVSKFLEASLPKH